MTEEHHEGVAEGIHGMICWDCGRPSDLSYARIVNGHERRALWIDLDGVRYVPVSTQARICQNNGKAAAAQPFQPLLKEPGGSTGTNPFELGA